jgi:hypothetical protein
VIGAESQAVLNTLTEHGFQDAFKKWQKLLRGCMWSVSSKSVFDRMAAEVQEIIDAISFSFLPLPLGQSPRGISSYSVNPG